MLKFIQGNDFNYWLPLVARTLYLRREVALESEIFDFLRCRVAASLGQQRLRGEFNNANSYEGRCTGKISPNVDADIGYVNSNVQNQETGNSEYNNQSFTGVLRFKF